MANNKNKTAILELLLSLLSLITVFRHNFHNNQLVITPNEMVVFFAVISPQTASRHFCVVCAQYQDLPCEGSSLHEARIQNLLPFSQKFLVPGTSQYQGQVRPFMCKLNNVNIQHWDNPTFSRILLVLDLPRSSLHVN